MRDKEVDSLLHCSLSPSSLSAVRDPTTGMLLDFTEVTLENIYYIRFAHLKVCFLIPFESSKIDSVLYLKPKLLKSFVLIKIKSK